MRQVKRIDMPARLETGSHCDCHLAAGDSPARSNADAPHAAHGLGTFLPHPRSKRVDASPSLGESVFEPACSTAERLERADDESLAALNLTSNSCFWFGRQEFASQI